MQLTVTRTASGQTTLAVSGDVDLATADELRGAGLDALGEATAEPLRIDLSGVTFLDSSALNALIAIRNASERAVVLVSPSRSTLRILQLTALDTVFVIDSGGEIPRPPAGPYDAPVNPDGPLNPA
jgi:anti-anti-sigma factor